MKSHDFQQGWKSWKPGGLKKNRLPASQPSILWYFIWVRPDPGAQSAVSSGWSGSGFLLQITFRKVPVDQMLEKAFDVSASLILVVQVIGMLPDVDG